MRTGLAAITSGVLLTLSLPPFGCASLIWVALVPLLIITKRTHGIIRPFSYGTTAAVILFVGAGYGLLPYDPPLAILYPIALSLLVGTVFAVQAIFLQRGLPRWLGVLVVSSLWVLAEYGSTAIGIPWTLALSQTPHLSVVQSASVFGVFWISFLIVLVNAAVADGLIFTWSPHRRLGDLAGLLVAAVAVALNLAYGWLCLTHSEHDAASLRFASIQPMLASEVYTYQWLNPEYRLTARGVVGQLSTEAAQARPDLLLWPENGNGQLNFRVPALREQIAALARQGGSNLLISSYDRDESGRLYNAVFSVSREGRLLGRYAKVHLAPGGEKGFSPGSAVVPLPTSYGPIGTLVCLESCYPWMARSMTLQGAVLLVVTTSDVAMRRSALPFHHARFAVYRAIENRRWLIQTSNAGPSFVISPYGDITAETPPWVRTILQGQAGIVRERTLYTQLGDGPLLLLVGCILVFGLLASQRARGRMRWMHGSGAVSGDRPWGTLITTFSGGVLAGLCLATVSIGMLGAGQQGWAAWAESLRTFLRPPVIAIPPAADAEYLQTRSNTCGAAALAYALRLFGADVREGDVLRQVDLHPEGTSMTDLISAARSEGFVAWGEHQNLAALRAVPKPVIAHIRDDHYVVVLSVDGNRVDLFDPAAGYTEMAAEAFSRFWQGNVLMLRVAPLYDPDGATLASGRGS